MTTHPRDNLVAWLRDAYAMEGQAIQLPNARSSVWTHYPELRGKLQETPETDSGPTGGPGAGFHSARQRSLRL